MSVDVEALVRGYWQRVWLERDLDAIDEFFADPTIRHTVDGTVRHSVAELRRRIDDGLRAVRGTEISVDAVTVVGDTAWTRVTLRGTSLPSMTPMTVTWMAQYRIADGLIAESWALHQAGLDWASQ